MSRTEPLTEQDERIVAAAEADLQRLLSIEPPPEFAARVRVRIHERRESQATRWGWIGLAIATAVALIFVAVLRMNDSSSGIQNAEIVTRPDTPLAVPPAPVERGSTAATTAAQHVAVHKQTSHVAEAATSPEIIIDPALTAAIQRLAAAARNAILDASNGESIAADAHAAALPIAEPLKVPELVLSPVDPNGGQ
jgi:hypothetical protein